MIRMLMVYVALFVAAAGALWLTPTSNDTLAALEPSDTAVPVSVPQASVSAPVPVENSVPTTDAATLVVRKLQEDAAGSGLAALLETPDGAIDLAPLLDDVPGTVRGADGTRILASALLRRPAPVAREVPAPVAPPPSTEVTAVAAAPVVFNAPATSPTPAPRPERPERQVASVTPDLSAQVRNIETVSAPPASEAISTEAPVVSAEAIEAALKSYTVQPGDSLGSIAIAHYGTPSAFRKIFEANRAVLPSIDALRVGQTLQLP